MHLCRISNWVLGVMAEARQASGFKLVVLQDGTFEWDFDIAAFVLVINSIRRSAKKRFSLVLNNIKNTLFPIKIELFIANITLLTLVHLAGFDLTFGVTQSIINLIGRSL